MPRTRTTGTPTTTKPEDTRMQRDRMQAEKEREQADRASELSMITAKESADDRDGVWDGQNGELLQAGMDEDTQEQMRRYLQAPGGPDEEDEIFDPEDAQITTRPSQQVRRDGPNIGPNGVPIDPQAIEQMRDDVEEAVADYTPERPNVTVQRVQQTDRLRVIRVNADLDPTIGQGPNSQWHFKKGRRYRVPEHVAFHLHEKGYVSSWG